MKRLTCEMCGSNDLLKQNGVFVCQTCGCKYSVEEAKRMMIEGTVDVSGSTVKVDSSDKLENLLTLAKRAREEDNVEEAEKYYSLALLEAPDNWTANFYSSYYKLLSSPIAKLETNLDNFKSRASSTLKMLLKTGEDTTEFYSSVANIYFIVAQHMNKRENELTSELFAAGLSSVKIEIASKNMKTELPKLWNYTCEIEDSAIELFDIEKKNGSIVYNEALNLLFQMCDKAVNIGSKRIIENNNYIAYVQKIISFVRAANELMPGFVSETVTDMKGRASKFQGTKEKMGKDIIRMLTDFERELKEKEEAKKEKERKERIVQYWDNHSDKKAKLDAEQAEIQKQIYELNVQIVSVDKANAPKIADLEKALKEKTPTELEVEKQDQVVRDVERQRNNCGIFKGKEKKALTERLNTIERPRLEELKKKAEAEKKAHQSSINTQISELRNDRKDLRDKLSMLKQRDSEITTILTQDR